ncbi:RNA recognition motif domain-containing protein [Streptomyces flaveolus]|uniref:RNA recognition motif domain-containing protein n=1 Tax=Streptomyces flaveolus TaxID=67297 RepID=UPI0036FD9E7B
MAPDTTDGRLRRAFEEHGPVVGAAVQHDAATGRSEGFGFVEISSEHAAAAAIDALHGAGRPLVVHKARTMPGC